MLQDIPFFRSPLFHLQMLSAFLFTPAHPGPLLGCLHRPVLLSNSSAENFSFPFSYQNLHIPEMGFRLHSSHFIAQGTKTQKGDMNCPSSCDLLGGLAETESGLLTPSPLLFFSHFATHPGSQHLQPLAAVKRLARPSL